MGEIAEAMLDGTFCQSCGQYIDDGESPGFPRFCGGCGGDPETYGATQRTGGGKRPSHWKPKRKIKSSHVGLLIGAMGDVQVVDPRTLETLPMGTVVYCTPGDLRCVADLLQKGAGVDKIKPHLTALLAARQANRPPAHAVR